MAARSSCAINGSLEIFGDSWTLLILRDMIFAGKSRYNEFLNSEEKIATNILGARLSMLESKEIIAKQPDPDDGRRNHYLLTHRGLDLIPVLLEMMIWGENNLAGVDIREGLQASLTESRDEVIAELRNRMLAAGRVVTP